MPELADLPAVFLVGGRGTRLGLGDLPKAMVDFEGMPLLERMVRSVAAQGVKRFIFLAGFSAEHIESHFGDGSAFGVSIETIVEQEPLGTAGAFDLLRDRLDQPFLVFYGDVLFDVELARFVGFAQAKGGWGTLYVHPNDHPGDSDLVDVDDDGRVLRFVAKPHSAEDGFGCGNLVNAAFYYFTPEILQAVPRNPQGVVDWGRDLLPDVVAAGHDLFAYRGTEYLKDMGTPDRLERGRNDYLSGKVNSLCYRNRQRAVFLDRDGVLNREVDGVFRPDLLELLPGASEAVGRINKSPFLAICVTNQPAIAKGFMTFDDLKHVHWRLDQDLAQSGAYLDDMFVCPHHPERGFEGEVAELKRDCDCRKPKPGMLLAAAARHNIDLSSSYLIGDHERDINAGLDVGAGCYHVGQTGTHGSARPGAADAVRSVGSVLDAVEDILQIEQVAT